ncbi:MAG: Spy/CpxP family protein refolding chaperone [Candidatus Cloacimonadaceae bacterium]|jgi:Spy/CpxP family protein refolding chaperone|nr:Spy/CpxP family protein refolding chaperone [Candidatus Cloacimonadota bacterium]MCB5257542.1 Spy/CpxP family protein refolding chaperone [Candidatus Cloacimonadota bacterium]MDD5625221.1 Spy/CpxP family protein refolding chaperone [Candidatus Cloacimonadota bacterium]
MKKTIIITLIALMLIGIIWAKDTAKNPPPSNVKSDQTSKVIINPEMNIRLGQAGFQKALKELNLTDAQKRKLDELQLNHRKAMNTINAEIRNLQLDLRKALKEEDYTTSKILNSQLYEKKRVRANNRIELKEQIMKELTSEQKAKLQSIFPGGGLGLGPREGKFSPNYERCPQWKERHPSSERNL